MKNIIMSTLISAAQLVRDMKDITKRIIGEKADVVTRGDIEIGNLMIRELLGQSSKILIESEEKGKQSNFENGQEDYYIVIDDIDGTNNLRVGNGLLPYGSIIVVFDAKNKHGENYKFSDYSYAAYIDYSTRRIFFTERGLGRVEEYTLKGEIVKTSLDNINDNNNLTLTLATDYVCNNRKGTGYAQNKEKDIAILPSIFEEVVKKYVMLDCGCSGFDYSMVGMRVKDGYLAKRKKDA